MTTIQSSTGPTTATAVGYPQTPAAADLDADDPNTLLPEPMCVGGDALTQIAVLMTESGLQEQTDSTRAEDAANAAIAKDDQARVAQMMDKANQDLGAAVAQGVGDIAGGALGIAGAFVSAKPGGTDWPAAFAGASKVMPGAGTIVSGAYKSAADQDDARAAELQSASDMDGRAYQSAQSAAQAASDQIVKVEQMLQQIQQTQNDTAVKAAGG